MEVDPDELEQQVRAYLASSHSTTWGKSFTIKGKNSADTTEDCVSFIMKTIGGVFAVETDL